MKQPPKPLSGRLQQLYELQVRHDCSFIGISDAAFDAKGLKRPSDDEVAQVRDYAVALRSSNIARQSVAARELLVKRGLPVPAPETCYSVAP